MNYKVGDLVKWDVNKLEHWASSFINVVTNNYLTITRIVEAPIYYTIYLEDFTGYTWYFAIEHFDKYIETGQAQIIPITGEPYKPNRFNNLEI